MRRYVEQFLHGKAYLFGSVDDARAALVTSANLTGAGSSANLELGVVDYNPGPSRKALDWFDALWERAAPFGDELRDLLFPAGRHRRPADGLSARAARAVRRRGARRLGRPRSRGSSWRRFQRDGYERARRILARHGGVVYADGVGTGKTEIGLAFIEEIAPASRDVLRSSSAPRSYAENWQKRIAQARLPAEVLSLQRARARTSSSLPMQPARADTSSADKDAYRLVVVDEAHALRNEDTSWYAAMERLLGGERKKRRAADGDAGQQRALGPLQPRDAVRASRSRIHVDRASPRCASCSSPRAPTAATRRASTPICCSRSPTPSRVRRDRRFIQQRYPGEVFADGTPVRFPEPRPADTALRPRRRAPRARARGRRGDRRARDGALPAERLAR